MGKCRQTCCICSKQRLIGMPGIATWNVSMFIWKNFLKSSWSVKQRSFKILLQAPLFACLRSHSFPQIFFFFFLHISKSSVIAFTATVALLKTASKRISKQCFELIYKNILKKIIPVLGPLNILSISCSYFLLTHHWRCLKN